MFNEQTFEELKALDQQYSECYIGSCERRILLDGTVYTLRGQHHPMLKKYDYTVTRFGVVSVLQLEPRLYDKTAVCYKLDELVMPEKATRNDEPDKNCYTLPNGECVGGTLMGRDPCLHDVQACSGAVDSDAPWNRVLDNYITELKESAE
jgi:hypothetical protein